MGAAGGGIRKKENKGGNAMKRRIDYESKIVLPDEIVKFFREAEKNILDSKHEPDKIILHLGQLRYKCGVWFSDHETIMEETK
jgi:hypothetical protein